MATTELGTAYVSIVGETSKLEDSIKTALKGAGKQADLAGKDIGSRISKSASRAMKDGWRPDQDIMAGIPNTKLDRIGARMGQVIGKGVAGGLKAQQLGREFGSSFASGAGSVGLGKVVAGWRGDLKDQPHKLGYLAGKGISAGLQLGMVGATAIIGTALKSGFDRLVALDTAQNKLRAILRTQGNSQEFDKINKAVQKSVDGTPFSLDQAFNTAVMAIGAGSQDIERFMKNVSDAAGFAGTDMERMGLIFNQVLAKGKLTGEETMQLMEAGLPARSWIQDSYKLTAEQFDDMSKNGEISLDMLQKSIEDHAPGMAKALGNTLQGSIDNMQTAMAKVGANFLSAIFGGAGGDDTETMKDAIQKITEYLNKMSNWVNAHRDDIRQFFSNAANVAKELSEIVGKILGYLKEHPGAIEAVVVAFAAWKTIKFVSLLAELGKVSGALSTIALHPAFIALAAIAGGGAVGAITLDNAINENGAGSEAGQNALNQATAPGMGVPGASRDPIFGAGGPNIPGGGGPGASRQRRGLPPLSVGGGGSFGGGVPGTAGRGYFNSGAASAYLDRQTVDASLLSNVPSGVYSQTQSADLTQGLADCSSAVEDLVNLMDGMPTAGRQMSTGNAAEWLTSRGFMPGTQQGAFNVGFNSSHMQATLPGGTPFNWGSQAAAARGGVGGTGAFDPAFTQRFFRPFGKGGGVSGPGSGTSDSIPARLSNGEHVLSSKDVKAMGGQKGVYGFRKALHFAKGGAVSIEDMRTAGAIPAAAGSTAKAGESSIASAIDMGGELINGLIDQAASAAATAASAAVAGGTMGAGAMGGSQAAGAATQFAIGMGTNAAKRGVTYGFDMLGIGADSILQQLTPFGQPRWLSEDYTGFMPQQAITGALGELMSGGAQQALDPNTLTHGGAQGAEPGPIDNLVGSLAGPDTTVPGAMPGPGMFENSANSFLSTELSAPDAPAPNAQPIFKVDNIYTSDAEGVGRELTKRGRLQQMQYTGRPGP